MATINPDTLAPRFTDYRKAVHDGRVTKKEAQELIATHAEDMKTDPAFAKAIEDLANGKAKWTDFTGGEPRQKPVKVTSAARSVLQQMLANRAGAGGFHFPTKEQLTKIYGDIAAEAMKNGSATRLDCPPQGVEGAARFDVTPEGLQDSVRQVFLIGGALYLQESSLFGTDGRPSATWYAVGPAPLF